MSARWSLLLLSLVLTALGLLFVFEASTAEAFQLVGNPFFFLRQQAIRAVIGLAALVVMLLIPTKWLEKAAPVLYLGSLLLLVAVLIPGIGVELNGARRWLSIGSFLFQPVELVKLSCVIFFASWMSRHQRWAPFLFWTGLPMGLILLQPDLGSMLVVASIAVGLFFVAGGKLANLAVLLALGVAGIGAAIISSPYRLQRVTTYFDPSQDPLGAGFHVRQITLALANGGWFGQGLGNSSQKYFYVPEASTDSIFAIIAEEIGFVGCGVLLALFVWLFSLLYQLHLRHEPGTFAHLLVLGILIWLAAQTCLNLAAVVALVPLTGVPLPFFSYGGTSLVMVLLATGIVLRASAAKQ